MAKIQIEAAGRPFPLGAKTEHGITCFSFASKKKGAAKLHLYKKGQEKEAAVISFPGENRLGDIRYVAFSGISCSDYEYSLSIDGEMQEDSHAVLTAGRETWGEEGKALRYGFLTEGFDWEGDKAPGYSFADTVIYRLHVRGFTKHSSSGVKHKGTFRGVIEKLPYIKSLGATMVELQLPDDFKEVPPARASHAYQYGRTEGKLNYWGYGPADCFAPKAAYCVHGKGGADVQFKELVKACHKLGLELSLELWFGADAGVSYVLDCLRHWVSEYHVDGIHVAGNVDMNAVISDPALTGIKLFSGNLGEIPRGMEGRLAPYRDDFQNDMRRFLKGDEDCLRSLTYQIRESGKINYMADTNGFTMYDMVSYDRKHNEANGENGKDGPDYNYSWNCGAEGPVKKKKILELRKRQLRNSWVFLTVAQGIPLILAGDERGNSQEGNNNAYCQDNPVGWVNWKLGKLQKDILEFASYMLAFRKAHPMLHKEGGLRGMDYKGVGCPDFSVHGEAPWYPQYDNYRRQIGFLYCGRFAEDRDIYVIFNMHWEPHEFSLPHAGGKWRLAVDTAREESNGICDEILENQEVLTLSGRSAAILTAEEETDREGEANGKEARA